MMDEDTTREALALIEDAIELCDQTLHDIRQIKREIATAHAYQAAANERRGLA